MKPFPGLRSVEVLIARSVWEDLVLSPGSTSGGAKGGDQLATKDCPATDTVFLVLKEV